MSVVATLKISQSVVQPDVCNFGQSLPTTANDRPTHPAYPAPLFIRHLPTGWQQSLILLLPSVRQLPLPEALLCFLSYTQRFKIPQHTFNTYFPLLLKKTVRRFYFPIFYDTLLSRRFALSA